MVVAEKEPEEICAITDASVKTPLLSSSSARHQPRLTSATRRRITIEPITFIESVSYGLTLALRPQFIQQRLADDYNLTADDNVQLCSNSTNSTADDDLATTIQSEAALWLMYLSICSYFPAIFATTIIGTLSDSIGRKVALGVPMVGFIIQNATYLLVFYFDLPLWVLLIGEVLQGCTGGVSLLICGSLSYIADITTLEERTWRIVIVEMTLFVGSGIMQIGNGYMLKYLGYASPAWLSTCLLVLASLYIVIPPFLIETIPFHKPPVTFLKKVFQDACALFEDNAGGRRWKLLILNSLIVIIDMATIGFFSILILHVLDKPFCWSPVLVGYITTTAFLTTGIGMIFGAKIFSFCLNEYWILHISCISAIVSMVMTALASSAPAIFIATALGGLRTLATPMVRSVMSQTVTTKEQGVMFAFQNSVENIGVFLSPIILNAVYSATVATVPGVTFYLIAGLHVVPMMFTGILQILDKKKVNYESLN